MKLNVWALALAAAIIWGASMFLIGLANMMFPAYGVEFLSVMSSLYPGYQPTAGFASVILGTVYGFIDAGIVAAIFAWIYNLFVK